MRKKPSKTSGAAKLRRRGRRGILIAVRPQEYVRLKRYAKSINRTMAGFVRDVALDAARGIIIPKRP